MSAMLTSGPATAADLATRIGLTPAGIRRHLDKMLAEDLIEPCEAQAGPQQPQSRGRPAQHYRLTTSGRDAFGSHYDELALAAFAEIEELGGRDAVRRFARKRAATLLGSVDKRRAPAASAGTDPEAVTHRIAGAFAAHGYVADVNNVGSGLQLCQHHCPVHAAAHAYPEICEAEHELVSELVGSHVAPLALIANGDRVCTTLIPVRDTPLEDHLKERSGDDD